MSVAVTGPPLSGVNDPGVVLCLCVCLFTNVRLCSRVPIGRGRTRLVGGDVIHLYRLAHLYLRLLQIILWLSLHQHDNTARGNPSSPHVYDVSNVIYSHTT